MRSVPRRLRTAALSLGLAGVMLTTGQATAAQPDRGPSPAASAATLAKPRKPGPAQVVVMVRTGGIAGATSVHTLAGSDNEHTAEILRLASSPAFHALAPRYTSEDPCCDRFGHRVEVGYRGGAKKTVDHLAGTPGTPQVLLDVINLMETTVPAAELPADRLTG